MAKVQTIICLEIAFNGKKEIIWLKATEIYQWQEAHNSNRKIKGGGKKMNIYFLMRRVETTYLPLVLIKFHLTNGEYQ